MLFLQRKQSNLPSLGFTVVSLIFHWTSVTNEPPLLHDCCLLHLPTKIFARMCHLWIYSTAQQCKSQHVNFLCQRAVLQYISELSEQHQPELSPCSYGSRHILAKFLDCLSVLLINNWNNLRLCVKMKLFISDDCVWLDSNILNINLILNKTIIELQCTVLDLLTEYSIHIHIFMLQNIVVNV